MKTIRQLIDEINKPKVTLKMQAFARRWNVPYDTVKAWYYGQKATPEHKLVLFNLQPSLERAKAVIAARKKS